MESETRYYANTFERLGRQTLKELANFPETALRWPLPLPEGDSLFRRAVRLFEVSAFWVLEVVGGLDWLDGQKVEEETGGTFANLTRRYERWISALHEVLDTLPDARLDLPVDVPFPHQDLFDGKMTTIRACLLYAIEQCAVQVGHIQFICQLFADGERELVEVTELARENMIIAGQIDDYV